MRKYILIFAAFALIGTTACNDWLDVRPKTTVGEEELFSREVGFMEALAGIYIKMAKPELYARTLSYGFIDVLGQRYQYGDWGNADFYTFPSARNEATLNSIWRSMYNQIANINNLLHWTDKNRHVFTTDGYYELVKGEALGLRAFMHFDLLRMYGPVYMNDPQAARISYRREFSRDPQEPLPSDQVITAILEDLAAAEELLADADPLLFTFPRTKTEEDILYTGNDVFKTYRQCRMNLYAVRAMMARVHLWAGDTAQAARYAQMVVDSRQFELVDNALDRARSREVIFSIYVDRFNEQAGRDFFGEYPQYSIASRTFLDAQFSVAEDGANDTRYREGTGFEQNGAVWVSVKYRQTGLWWSTMNTVRLIGLPEMYYILAECTADHTESARYLNRVRDRRAIEPTSYSTPAAKRNAIEREYRKEFYGEGQLFFFYKRLGYETFLHSPLRVMTDANYVFSIPDDEVIFGKS